MDPRLAERLDAVRPDSDDLSEPDMAAVRDALARDEALRADARRRQAWDRGIAAALHDVPVPDGLRDRLITRLAPAPVTAPPPAAPPRPAKLTRRNALGLVAGLAAGLAAAAVYWTVAGPTDPVSVAELQLAAASPGQTPFHGDFEPHLPDAWRRRLAVSERPVGLLRQRGRDRAAAWTFSLGRFTGVLVALPADRVTVPPAATSLQSADYDILPGAQTAAWTDHGVVYVCRFEGHIGDLARVLEPLAA
jgi:hypothetical protein